MEFEQIMRENGPMIYTLAVRLTGSTVDGQDLAQETFVKAYENFSRFRGDSAAGTWLYRICINAWKNRVRYEKRRSFWRHFSIGSSAGDGAGVPDVAAPEAPAGTELEGSDRQTLVQNALGRLGHEDRALLVMRDMDDKSYEEISELLGVPLGTVKSRLARSRERLRQILEPIKNTL